MDNYILTNLPRIMEPSTRPGSNFWWHPSIYPSIHPSIHPINMYIHMCMYTQYKVYMCIYIYTYIYIYNIIQYYTVIYLHITYHCLCCSLSWCPSGRSWCGRRSRWSNPRCRRMPSSSWALFWFFLGGKWWEIQPMNGGKWWKNDDKYPYFLEYPNFRAEPCISSWYIQCEIAIKLAHIAVHIAVWSPFSGDFSSCGLETSTENGAYIPEIQQWWQYLRQKFIGNQGAMFFPTKRPWWMWRWTFLIDWTTSMCKLKQLITWLKIPFLSVTNLCYTWKYNALYISLYIINHRFLIWYYL